jgi:hypothetical protein
MKKLILSLSLTVISLIGYAQVAPKIDTTKRWTIHGENTLLINQSSFSNWSSGGVNSVAGNILLNYDFNYKKDLWSWDNKVILGYGLSKQQDIGSRKNDDRIILNSLLGRLLNIGYILFMRISRLSLQRVMIIRQLLKR